LPADKQETPDRVALGRNLYFDRRLSSDGNVSCSPCHDIGRGFTDRRPVSKCVSGQLGRRSAPTTMNAAFSQSLVWDDRVAKPRGAGQAPILNPVEMGQHHPAAAMKAIAADQSYEPLCTTC
jgi:cytochrome c peroxidase